MTSPLRRKLPITALNSQAPAIPSRRALSLQRFLAIASMSVAATSGTALMAQQPSWSPQPFTPPANVKQLNPPSSNPAFGSDYSVKPDQAKPDQGNSLRDSSRQPIANSNPLRGPSMTAETSNAKEPKPAVVARWKQSSMAKASQELKRRDAERNQVATAQFTEEVHQETPPENMAMPQNSGMPSTLRSVRKNQSNQGGKVVAAQYQQLTQERERSGGMLGGPERIQGGQPGGQAGRQETFPQLPSLEPPADDASNEPPSMPNEANDDLPSLDADNSRQPMEFGDAPQQEEEEAAPVPPRANPFGNNGSNSMRSQEDREEKLNPGEPSDNFKIDCEKMREKALGDDITKISLNVSPAFGIGVGEEITSDEKRQRFAKNAPKRAWYDFKGQFIVDAKLIDLRHDHVMLESESGATQKVRVDRLSDPDMVYLAEVWQLPITCSLGFQADKGRSFTPITAEWTASGLCHNPLYFEDVQLERYGHEIGPVVQPLASTAHFFGNIAVLPYKMGIHPSNECQYALGYYRPGNCAPWTVGPVPISLKGALFQAGAVTGMVGTVP